MPLILAVRAEKMPDVMQRAAGGFFVSMQAEAISTYFGLSGLWLGPRAMLETMPEFRQIIPYIAVRYEDQFVTYRRTPKGAESRLHDKYSIGLGGHMDITDMVLAGTEIDFGATMKVAAQRELAEEIKGTLHAKEMRCLGFLGTNEDEVGRVHMGILFEIVLSAPPVIEAGEDDIGAPKLRSYMELVSTTFGDKLEPWTRIALESAFKRDIASDMARQREETMAKERQTRADIDRKVQSYRDQLEHEAFGFQPYDPNANQSTVPGGPQEEPIRRAYMGQPRGNDLPPPEAFTSQNGMDVAITKVGDVSELKVTVK